MNKQLQLTFITLAVALGFLYFVAPDCLNHRVSCLGLADGQPTAPNVYRILPQALFSVFTPATPEGVLWIATLAQMAGVAVIMPLLYYWLNQSIEGVLIFGVVWLMAQHFWFVSVGSTLEILFVVLSLALINRTWLWLIPITALAALNRETGLLIPCIYFAYHGRKEWQRALMLISVWAAITSLLHFVIGSYPHVLGVEGTLYMNLTMLADGFLANLLLLPLAIATYMGYKRATKRFKRFAWVSLVYAAAIVGGGAWAEVQRLILPIVPLILPLVLIKVIPIVPINIDNKVGKMNGDFKVTNTRKQDHDQVRTSATGRGLR